MRRLPRALGLVETVWRNSRGMSRGRNLNNPLACRSFSPQGGGSCLQSTVSRQCLVFSISSVINMDRARCPLFTLQALEFNSAKRCKQMSSIKLACVCYVRMVCMQHVLDDLPKLPLIQVGQLDNLLNLPPKTTCNVSAAISSLSKPAQQPVKLCNQEPQIFLPSPRGSSPCVISGPECRPDCDVASTPFVCLASGSIC